MVKQWVLNVTPEPGSQEPDIIPFPDMPNSPSESDGILGDNSNLGSDDSDEESTDEEHLSDNSEQESNLSVNMESDVGTCTDPYASSADNSSYYGNGPSEGDGYDFVARDPPPHYLQPEFDEKIQRVEDEQVIVLAMLQNEEQYLVADEIRKRRFEEALAKEAYAILGNFFYIMKEYHGCRKLAQRLWKGLSEKNGYNDSDGDFIVKRKPPGHQWIPTHTLNGFFPDLVRELNAHKAALTLKHNHRKDLLKTPPILNLETIREQLGLTWKELPSRFKEEIDRSWEVFRGKAREEIAREKLLETKVEKKSHQKTLKIARFLLEYFKLWDDKSTIYNRGSPEMEAAAYALVIAEKNFLIETALTPKPKLRRRMVRSGEVVGNPAESPLGESITGQNKRTFGDGSDTDKENEAPVKRRRTRISTPSSSLPTRTTTPPLDDNTSSPIRTTTSPHNGNLSLTQQQELTEIKRMEYELAQKQLQLLKKKEAFVMKFGMHMLYKLHEK
ncbi:hypothetical protein BZA77DRAFT_372620 [Pyronema omphalodes]|nr:hypothetical protein BZA77DRAFT_372620 [Pyronema omphalodes]